MRLVPTKSGAQGCANPIYPMALTTDQLLSLNPSDLVDFLVQRKSLLSSEIRERLYTEFAPASAPRRMQIIPIPENCRPGEGLDLYKEVQDQLQAVQLLRSSVITVDNGVATLSAGVRETKEALSAATTLLKLLVDLESEVMNMSRIRTIQKTTIEVLEELGPDVQSKFLELLESRLGEL